MNLLEVRYTIGNEKVIEIQTEEDFLQFVTQLCWEKFQWTPLLEICDGVIFPHSETWGKDYYSEDGNREWIQQNIDIENDSDEKFFEKLKKLLKIKSN